MVKVNFRIKVKVKGKVLVMVLGPQIRFPENLVKIRQAGASEKVILQKSRSRLRSWSRSSRWLNNSSLLITSEDPFLELAQSSVRDVNSESSPLMLLWHHT